MLDLITLHGFFGAITVLVMIVVACVFDVTLAICALLSFLGLFLLSIGLTKLDLKMKGRLTSWLYIGLVVLYLLSIWSFAAGILPYNRLQRTFF
ncbi:hypothetical protein [Acinetobacter sp. MD2(2019)]|uniref:hypothetical protein n=1 Tax=Acinetobacter sp. MD2(2019) TaxID=2605273 RepID=UPI002D1F06F3|nr:hypothetical protein [Acinetobacter sp. MD2(2019)]MEB3754649.1 hypothetical protein [Acinetobacter sp. MD2(2019)]